MHIDNATDFHVDMAIGGVSGTGPSELNTFMKIKLFPPRSFALICAKNEYKTKTPYRDIVFGKRRNGDSILYVKVFKFSATENKLPRYEIEINDQNAVFTSVSIRLKVRIFFQFNFQFRLNSCRTCKNIELKMLTVRYRRIIGEQMSETVKIILK